MTSRWPLVRRGTDWLSDIFCRDESGRTAHRLISYATCEVRRCSAV